MNIFLSDTGDEGDDDDEGKHKDDKDKKDEKKKTEINLGKLLFLLYSINFYILIDFYFCTIFHSLEEKMAISTCILSCLVYSIGGFLTQTGQVLYV